MKVRHKTLGAINNADSQNIQMGVQSHYRITMFSKIDESLILDRADILDSLEIAHSYQKSYQYFIDYFSDGRVLTERDLVISANFTYGWMPTILKFKELVDRDFSSAVDAINQARSPYPISNDELLKLKKVINNSIVGASKLLHFINPNVYAIWDSRVCNFLLNKHNQKILSSSEVFKSYLELCSRVVSGSSFRAIHDSFVNKIGYEVSELRTVEQIMFHSSDRPLGAPK